jgi:hypothetical protein
MDEEDEDSPGDAVDGVADVDKPKTNGIQHGDNGH